MKKLYTVRHWVLANSVKEAMKEASKQEPQEVYIADEWLNKIGFLNPPSIEGIKSRSGR